MSERLKKDVVYDAYTQLEVPQPSEKEKGKGAPPPSVRAGNPGLQPVVRDETSATAELDYWANKILTLAIKLERLQDEKRPPAEITRPSEKVLLAVLEALKGKYVKGENLGVTTLRLRLQSAMEDLDQERPLLDRKKNPDAKRM